MKKILTILLLITIFYGCKKEPSACYTISTEHPTFGETIEIDASCCKNNKWTEIYVDGVVINDGKNKASYKVKSSGSHEIQIRAYQDFKGAPFKNACTNCEGKGDMNSVNGNFICPSTVAITGNTSLSFGDDLFLQAPFLPEASYLWSGPNFFSSDQYEINIANVNAQNQGIYTVTVSLGGSSVTGSVNVTIASVSPSCNPTTNFCSFTGGLPSSSLGNIYTISTNGYYELHAGSPNLNITLRFKGAGAPPDGIYYATSDYYFSDNKEVNLIIQPIVFLEEPVVSPGKVYVSVVNGKITAVFCNLQMTYNGVNYAATSKIVQP